MNLLRYFYSTPAWLVRAARKKNASQIALYGAGEVGIDVFHRLGATNVICWVDRNFANWPNGLLGKPVVPLDKMVSMQPDCILVCSEAYNREIYQSCMDANVDANKVILSDYAS